MGWSFGAVAGCVFFLAFGLKPELYFGSYAALAVNSHFINQLNAHTEELMVLYEAAVAVGLLLVGGLCVLAGSIAGSLLSRLCLQWGRNNLKEDLNPHS